tara:strand:+ start:161921 stop:165004 length:3084 start_codon:yes stop_codon:yes gene_type:complete
MKYIKYIVLSCVALLPFQMEAQNLRINELMPNTGITIFDGFGESSDWLELYNNSANPIQLSDYYISNDFSDKLKWKLPSKTLQPNDWIIVFCSKLDLYTPEYHANFKLKNETDTVGIFYKDGSTIDVLAYDSMPVDVSYGRKQDGSNNLFYFNAPSPNATNNNVIGYNCILNEPVVNVASGFYSSPKMVNVTHSVSGAQIHYRTDGSMPTELDPVINGNLNLFTDYSPNKFSVIPTNPGLNAPTGFYSVLRMNNRGWLPPHGNQQNINVLKVKAFKSGCISSQEVTRTYVLDDGNIDFPDMPIISLQADSSDLFSNDTGIYVYGNKYLGNYLRRGSEWERPMHLTYFDENKKMLIDQKLGGELHGNGSRHSTYKNFRVSSKSMYGNGAIKAELFDDYEIESFEHLILRSPGHRPDCISRDELAARFTENIGFDFQHFKTSIMYVNGEYWGINVMKERFDEDLLSEKYDMDEEEVVMLESSGNLEHGIDSDTAHYRDMIRFVQNNSLDDTANLNYLNTQMDMENYLDFMSSEIYLGNGDWPYNNMRFWRKRVAYDDYASKGHDGRWRWLLFDLDGGFGGTCEDVFYTINNVSRALLDTGIYANYTKLFIGFCQWETSRNMFINQACDRLNSNFRPWVTQKKLDEVVDNLNPNMLDHVKRWGYPSVSTTLVDRMAETPSLTKWNYLVGKLNSYVFLRNALVRRHMQEQWGLADSSLITVDVNDAQMGYVQINSLHLTAELEGVNASVYPWNGQYFDSINIPVKAHAFPGYRFKEWTGIPMLSADTFINVSSDTTLVAIFEIDPNYVAPLPIVINEIQAWNSSTVFDENLKYSDWIELYNPNNVDIDITDYYLTDNKDKLKKYWIGPNKTVIKAKDWMVFWADGVTGKGQNHTNFKLSKDGELVALVAPDGGTVVDSIRYGAQLENHSYGRQSDGLATWIDFLYPTPFYSNLSTSVEDMESKEPLMVFPNPVNGDMVYFSQTISGELYSVTGVLVKTFRHVNSLQVGELTNGVYVLRNSVSGESVKIMIQ